MDSPSESDYEYEYSTTETETFYITLDLTSHLPLASRKRKRDETVTNINHPTTPAPTSAPPAASRESTTRAQSEDGVPFAAGSHSEKAINRFQLLDLCTDNPLLNYNNKLYSCHWAAALGTDMLFDAKKKDSAGDKDNDNDTTTGPSEPQTEPPKPLLTKPNYTLLALSSLHLVATPAKLIPRPEPLTSAPTPTTPHPNPNPTTIQTKPTFLTRLAALKSLKNEPDTVPLHTHTHNHASFPISTPSYTRRSISPAGATKPSTPAPTISTPPPTPKTGPGSRGGKGSRGPSRRGGNRGGRPRGRGRGGGRSTDKRLEEQGVEGLGPATGTRMDWVVDPRLEALGGGGADGMMMDVGSGGGNTVGDTGGEQARRTITEGATSTSTSTSAGGGLDTNANANAHDAMMNDTPSAMT